jgi:hypothetical protein
MEQVDALKKGLVEMITRPDDFFKKTAVQDASYVLPLVILIITGILLGAVVSRQLPLKEEQWKKTGRDLAFNVEPQVKAEKAKATVFPFFTVGFFLVFNLCFGIVIHRLNGMGDFKGIFNCTSYLIYPYFVLALLKYLILFVPFLGFIYTLAMVVVTLGSAYLLVKIAQNAGQLDIMNAVVAALFPGFVFMLVWMSYDIVIQLLVQRFA